MDTPTEFESIVTAHYEPLYRFALSLAKCQSRACDLTQETFLIFAQKGAGIRDRSKIKSWLFTTLRREFLGERRHETRFPHEEVGEVEHELPTLTPDMAAQLDAADLVASLQELDEDFRMPLTLFYLEDVSYREIAEILEIPIGTVMSRLSRGKTLLRKSLEKSRLKAQSNLQNRPLSA
ncbi:MAG: RNA polymerase sigma factor [Verrucomicrobiae bacterium]|nr:RNA polymerase sigma factor [Verrucomicrobiae bacterium]